MGLALPADPLARDGLLEGGGDHALFAAGFRHLSTPARFRGPELLGEGPAFADLILPVDVFRRDPLRLCRVGVEEPPLGIRGVALERRHVRWPAAAASSAASSGPSPRLSAPSLHEVVRPRGPWPPAPVSPRASVRCRVACRPGDTPRPSASAAQRPADFAERRLLLGVVAFDPGHARAVAPDFRRPHHRAVIVLRLPVVLGGGGTHLGALRFAHTHKGPGGCPLGPSTLEGPPSASTLAGYSVSGSPATMNPHVLRCQGVISPDRRRAPPRGPPHPRSGG